MCIDICSASEDTYIYTKPCKSTAAPIGIYESRGLAAAVRRRSVPPVAPPDIGVRPPPPLFLALYAALLQTHTHTHTHARI